MLVPYHPYYSVLAGGPGHGHIMNVNDVSYTRKGTPAGLFGDPVARRKRVLQARRRLLNSLRQSLRSGRFVAVIHDRDVIARWLRRGDRAVARPRAAYAAQLPGLISRYRPTGDLTWLRAVPRTYTGNAVAPRYVWQWPRGATPPSGGRVVFDFETPRPAWWAPTEGTAFGPGPVDGLLWDVRRRRPQGLVGGMGGKRWISSFHGGDAATGRLVTKPFAIDRPRLQVRVGGGRDPERLAVRLKVAGKVVRQATGHNSEQFRVVRWDVRPWLGQQAVLEVVDQATGGWGHIQVDEVWLVPAGER